MASKVDPSAARYAALGAAATKAAANRGVTVKQLQSQMAKGPLKPVTKAPTVKPVSKPPVNTQTGLTINSLPGDQVTGIGAPDAGFVPPQTGDAGGAPVDATSNWAIENDPLYQSAIASGQSAFNVARAKALADLQNQQTAADTALRAQNKSAAKERRNLAGNYAARGMQGGARGAYSRAQDEANAELITAQTSTKDQLAALNQNFLANYGAVGSDWTGTTVGQDYKNQAVQQALTALTNKYTAV